MEYEIPEKTVYALSLQEEEFLSPSPIGMFSTVELAIEAVGRIEWSKMDYSKNEEGDIIPVELHVEWTEGGPSAENRGHWGWLGILENYRSQDDEYPRFLIDQLPLDYLGDPIDYQAANYAKSKLDAWLRHDRDEQAAR